VRKIEAAAEPPRASNEPSHGMESIFLRNCCYSAHVRLWLRPLLCYFGEKPFKSRGSDIHEHADRLIRIIFESVDRAAGGGLPCGKNRENTDRRASRVVNGARR
jgi:hypothetical protein